MNRVKQILLLVLALVMVFCLCACGEGGDETGASDAATNDSGIQDNGGSGELPTDETTEAPKGDQYVVTVKDTEGNPVVRAMVQICKDSCVPGVTDENGVAKFPVKPEEGYKVSFMTLPAGYAYTDEAVTEWYFEDGSCEMTIVLAKAAA